MTRDSTVLRDIGEEAVIENMRRLFDSSRVPLVGIGDDCAVVSSSSGNDMVMTSDAVIAGVHFTPGTPFRQVGHKAVARALSDVAAMGANPTWGLIDIVAPDDTPVGALNALCETAGTVASDHGMAIIGGDTAAGNTFQVHVFAVGTIPGGTAVLRSTATAGDTLFVTGSLGMSIEGKHLAFLPRLREGVWLREEGFATAMIDISDGLATDLHHVAYMSKAGAVIDEDALPLSAEARRTTDPIAHALYDGEDYELLFSVSPSRTEELVDTWANRFQTPLTRIGVVSETAGDVLLRRPDGTTQPIAKRGYDHFSRDDGA